ncbi:MAG: class I SAM-dependent methyltransferase [Patescibacteria group bacterium]|mgnify:CR=1 FL=1
MDTKTYIDKTGALYSSLFSAYDDRLFEESVDLFAARHRRWGIDTSWFRDKVCLDGGCGGGRYIVALSRLGAREVQGIDLSEQHIELVKKRITDRNLSQAHAQKASVLNIPFPDNYFDFVVSTGVIHHTPNPRKAFSELTRVLKPGGRMFLAVYGKGGIRWMGVDIVRATLAKIIPFTIAEKAAEMIGVPANKRYNYMDNFYVPYCFRFKEKEIRQWFEEEGFENVRRLPVDYYDYTKVMPRLLYGEGWIQMYANKK